MLYLEIHYDTIYNYEAHLILKLLIYLFHILHYTTEIFFLL